MKMQCTFSSTAARYFPYSGRQSHGSNQWVLSQKNRKTTSCIIADRMLHEQGFSQICWANSKESRGQQQFSFIVAYAIKLGECNFGPFCTPRIWLGRGVCVAFSLSHFNSTHLQLILGQNFLHFIVFCYVLLHFRFYYNSSPFPLVNLVRHVMDR